MVTEKETDIKQTWKNIYEVIENNHSEQPDVNFPKYFLLKCKATV